MKINMRVIAMKIMNKKLMNALPSSLLPPPPLSLLFVPASTIGTSSYLCQAHLMEVVTLKCSRNGRGGGKNQVVRGGVEERKGVRGTSGRRLERRETVEGIEGAEKRERKWRYTVWLRK